MANVFKLLGSNRKAGLAVSMINIPLCISLAIASGATPLMGLLTGVWAGIIAAIFCSSKHNVYGPAGSLAGILLPIALTYGVQFIPLLAIGGGIVITLFAALKLSKYITLIPGSALQGFLLGIGLIIGLQQVPGALGLNLDYSFTEAIMHLGETNFMALGVFLGALGILYVFKKWVPKVPGAVVVTILGVLLGRYVMTGGGISLELLVDRYSDVHFSLMHFFDRKSFGIIFKDMAILKTFIIASLGVGVIAILETLISAKIAAKETRVPYDTQKEIYGLGITNILTGIMGGLPASALVVRTGMNINSGATSKVSGALVGTFTAIFSLFLFSSALQFLPFAIIAAILIDVALSMINLSLYHKMWKVEKASILVILLVGVISYVRDPLMGILVGAVMTLLMFVKRTMALEIMANVFRNGHHFKKIPLSAYDSIQETGDLILIKLEGELSYLSIESHIKSMNIIKKATTIILGFGHAANIDTDAQDELEHMIAAWSKAGKEVYITGLHDQSLHMMEHGKVYHQLKKSGHIYESKSALLDKLLV